ncbi:hypothetical protein [Paraburkholderia tropica]|uniref:hypothetical protein n=1 Tax=Paraburkholderia tropica TaxID=92647 RepID=UPI0013748204|nr:hypothetical protein [Paraburkholderia tropica]
MPTDKCEVVKLRNRDPFAGLLQDELLAVIEQEKFGDLSVAVLVGVLEFLKWNLINRSD